MEWTGFFAFSEDGGKDQGDSESPLTSSACFKNGYKIIRREKKWIKFKNVRALLFLPLPRSPTHPHTHSSQ